MSLIRFAPSLLLFGSSIGYALPAPGVHTSKQVGNSNSSDVLAKLVTALGGQESLDLITGFTYQSSSIYRTQTLTQNYNLFKSDQTVSEAGSQNLSFTFSDGSLRERIDRSYKYDEYWWWAFPELEPKIDYTLVVQGGPNASACFTKGSNSFFADDPSVAAGYTDRYLTDYLVLQAQQYALPNLLKRLGQQSPNLTLSSTTDPFSNITYTALGAPGLDLEILIEDITFLPYAVRSHEVHAVFGPSTSDMLLIDLNPVSVDGNHSIMLPHRMQTVYNSASVLEDFVIDQITINPDFPAEFFAASVPTSSTNSIPSSSSSVLRPVSTATTYPRFEVHEFFETGLWAGPFSEMFNTSNVVLAPVFPNGTVPQIMNLYVGYPDYVQLLIEFEDGLLITDAPSQRSKVILDFVAENFNGKKITHVVPSHHHRDHAGDIGVYLAAGATLVVPEIAVDFYETYNNGSFNATTYTQDSPFLIGDDNVEFKSFWHDENPHAKDWTYGVASKAGAIASNDTEVAMFVADVVSPRSDQALRYDAGFARQWMERAILDGIPKHSVVIGAHGSTEIGLGTQDTLSNIARLIGVNYPTDAATVHWN